MRWTERESCRALVAVQRAEIEQLRARLAAVLTECDRADSAATDSLARTFAGQPFPASVPTDVIRQAATTP